jgi:N-acylneuraminate cytidylyltransferase
LLAGKPLIAHTIACAKNSKYIDRVVVSTDSAEIARVARECGAEVPFMRPSDISQGDSTELDAFRHALGWFKEHEGYEPDLIVKLFATSPFRRSETVDGGIELLMAHPEADSVRSVVKCSEHPYKMWTMEGERLCHFVPESQKPPQAHTLSYQVLPTVYIQNASFDVTRPRNVWEKGSITGTHILGVQMSDCESVDINNELDFLFAEFIFHGGVGC